VAILSAKPAFAVFCPRDFLAVSTEQRVIYLRNFGRVTIKKRRSKRVPTAKITSSNAQSDGQRHQKKEDVMFVFQNNWSFSQKKIVARRTCFLVDFFVKTIKNGSFLGEMNRFI
jgi:hypothetical protein